MGEWLPDSKTSVAHMDSGDFYESEKSFIAENDGALTITFIGEDEKNSELLRKYHELLSHSMKGFAVVLRRDIDEVWTNSFNHEWLEIWDSNLDVQIALDMYAIVTYITDYYLKVSN